MLQRSKFTVLVLLLVGLVACSTSKTPQYGKPKDADKSLEVPPELNQPSGSDRLTVPVISDGQTASSQQPGSDRQNNPVVLLPQSETALLKRDGDIRWLEIDASPEEVWRETQGFFRNLGFEIKYQDPQLGIIQTDWLKSKVYMPSNWFTRMLNALTSSGLMDKYRVRLERTEEADKTLLFMTHQGLEQVGVNEDAGTEVVEVYWNPRPSEPELEVEMMLRFLVFRGMEQEQAEKAVSGKPRTERAVIKQAETGQVILVNENFDRTWRRVGLAVDRLGLVVEDRNRSEGLYYLKLGEDFKKNHEEKKGLFGKLFGKGDEEQPDQFILRISTQEQSSQVSLHDQDGRVFATPGAEILLKELYAQLR